MEETAEWANLVKLELTSWIQSLGGKGGLSRGFFELIKGVGDARSKNEESRLIREEMVKLRALLSNPKTARKKRRLKECLIRLLYCEMLGHDVSSFGYIPCVNMTADANLACKTVGYLTCTHFLNPEHEYVLLLVNNWRRDLASGNFLEVSAALSAMIRLVNADTIPAVQDLVCRLVDHPHEAVRKKAVMVLHRFWQVRPRVLAEIQPRLKKSLYDAHPSVMTAALCFYHDLIKNAPAGSYREAIPSFVSILKQVSERALPSSYEYRRIPSPWLQIRLLNILAVLGHDDQRASEHMYEVIHQAMKRADTGINAGFAVVYECIRTITRIYPNPTLLDAAASCITRFIGHQGHNLKYLGLNALTLIVRVNPKYAVEHQITVLGCLEDRDDTLRRTTLHLLYEMTNPLNVELITAKCLAHLRVTTDPYLRKDLVLHTSENAEKYAPSTEWYIETMNALFLLAGDLVPREIAFNLLTLLAEGCGEDTPEAVEDDNDLRLYAVETFIDTLHDNHHLPDLQVQVIAWVLGEFGYLSSLGVHSIIDSLLDLADKASPQSSARGWIITAVGKLLSQLDQLSEAAVPSQVLELLDRYQMSRSVDIQQICYEVSALLKNPPLMKHVLPVDSALEDVEVDIELPFLDAFVDLSIDEGAREYDPPPRRTLYRSEMDQAALETKSLRFTAYEAPPPPKYLSRVADFAPPQSLVSQPPLAYAAPGSGGEPSPSTVPSPALASSPSSQYPVVPMAGAPAHLRPGLPSAAGRWGPAAAETPLSPPPLHSISAPPPPPHRGTRPNAPSSSTAVPPTSPAIAPEQAQLATALATSVASTPPDPSVSARTDRRARRNLRTKRAAEPASSSESAPSSTPPTPVISEPTPEVSEPTPAPAPEPTPTPTPVETPPSASAAPALIPDLLGMQTAAGPVVLLSNDLLDLTSPTPPRPLVPTIPPELLSLEADGLADPPAATTGQHPSTSLLDL